MGYTKTTWVNGGSPAINATNMNNIESGIEAVHKGTAIYAASSTGTDAYAVTFSPAFTSYNTGMVINFKADVGNTGTATLNVDSLGAKNIKKFISSGKTDVATGDIIASGIYTAVYDGTDFILTNPNSISTSLLPVQGDIIYASDAYTPSRLAKGSAYSAIISDGVSIKYGYPLTSYYYIDDVPPILESAQETSQFYDGGGTYWRTFATFTVNRTGKVRVLCTAKNTGNSGKIKVVGSISGDMCAAQNITSTYAEYTMDFTKDIFLGETLTIQLEGSAGNTGYAKLIKVKASFKAATESITR